MSVKFTVTGEPVGKGRPRFRVAGTKENPYVQTYTDDKTARYEDRVRAEYRKQCRSFKFEAGTMIDMRIIAYYRIPKSETKGMKTAMEARVIRPMKTPDCDNVLKVIADALNGVAYKDDRAIVDCQIRKYYSHQPRVEVTILPAKNERSQL